ncbi:SAM-dependent methyltransferase [Candidatus Micrarchaeota archaeon]|nr:SAM-dependent methyltransferase [Candidatus Micrarchaeota archaeon]MBD3418032.1 SAM-dependent methyltransferase [Candidatus Micrarchaeota archaeon]
MGAGWRLGVRLSPLWRTTRRKTALGFQRGFRITWKQTGLGSDWMIYLTRELVEKFQNGEKKLSLDLGRSVTMVTNELDGVPLDEVKGDFVYAWDGEELWKLAVFDDGLYRLRMMKGKPILEIDGLRMHLIKEFGDVFDYSELVVRELKLKQSDVVLDTCMGLGYTAIAASRKADRVVAIELSRAVLAMAKWNPWSRELFELDRIEVIEEKSCFDYIREAENEKFTKVIHDPPRFSNAGELYSRSFYRELKRVCKKDALLFHYVGSLGKKKRNIMGEVAKRLEECGWKVLKKDARLQGIVAKAV